MALAAASFVVGGGDGGGCGDSAHVKLNSSVLEDSVLLAAEQPAPKFDLSLFANFFQSGPGAVQITQLYSQFREAAVGSDDSENGSGAASTGGEFGGKLPESLSVSQLRDRMQGQLSEAKIEVLLETLVTAGLLRPLLVGREMYWQAR